MLASHFFTHAQLQTKKYVIHHDNPLQGCCATFDCIDSPPFPLLGQPNLKNQALLIFVGDEMVMHVVSNS